MLQMKKPFFYLCLFRLFENKLEKVCIRKSVELYDEISEKVFFISLHAHRLLSHTLEYYCNICLCNVKSCHIKWILLPQSTINIKVHQEPSTFFNKLLPCVKVLHFGKSVAIKCCNCVKVLQYKTSKFFRNWLLFRGASGLPKFDPRGGICKYGNFAKPSNYLE